ncbi:MAG: hypothetical protein ACI3U1_06480 [Peptococcaceae bacterium]
MTDNEMKNGVYAVMTNKPFCTVGKPKRKPMSEEVKQRRSYIKSHEIFLYVDENGKPYGTIKKRG